MAGLDRLHGRLQDLSAELDAALLEASRGPARSNMASTPFVGASPVFPGPGAVPGGSGSEDRLVQVLRELVTAAPGGGDRVERAPVPEKCDTGMTVLKFRAWRRSVEE